jgi:hypothetical protein
MTQRAVHDYFESSEDGQQPKSSQPRSSAVVVSDSDTAGDQKFNDPEPHRVRVMSWNIDGLDQNNIATRAKAVCKTILQ